MMESHVAPGKPLTRIQHAVMLTGAPPEVTTILSNNGSSSVPVGITIYERLRALVGDDVGYAHVGSHRYTVRGILNWVSGSLIPWDNIRTRGRPDKFTGLGSNENLFPILTQFEDKSFFVFEHQKGIDMAGHGAGDRSLQYRIAMVAADDRLRELLDKLQELGLLERASVFVTTDHGFWHNTHLGGLRPAVGRTWFASRTEPLACYTRGAMVDVVPTILDAFGVDYRTSVPALRGKSLLDRNREGECIPPVCGNGVVEVGEDCEADIPLTETCESLDYQRGDIACGSDCLYSTSECADLLATTKLAISPSRSGAGVEIQIKMFDRDRGGPDFDAASDAIDIRVMSGSTAVYLGGTSNFDANWRAYGKGSAWSADRGARADGLFAMKMSSKVRRFKGQINAGLVNGVTGFLDLTSVRLELRIGQERFDTNLPCRVTRDQTGLRCEYTTPIELVRERRKDRDKEAPR